MAARRETQLTACVFASAAGYAALSWLSLQFVEKVPAAERPTLWMLALFAAEFVCYAIALRIAVQLPPSRALVRRIVLAACLFRVVLLPSAPMHEIDIYRYIWDGAVVAEGISPHRYAPRQVLDAVPIGTTDAKLGRLLTRVAQSESLAYSLGRIHYSELPSPYPAVSQAVFAAAALVTPDGVGAHMRLVIMKLLLVLFDLATLLVVLALLLDVGLHPAWSIAYGWCPLVMKEIAGGGHLDSIAIFLTTLAIWLLVRTGRANGASAAMTGATLALAVGAKLYPVVLLPLFTAVWWRRGRWRAVTAGLLTTAALSAVLLAPLLLAKNRSAPIETSVAVPQVNVPGLAPPLVEMPPSTPPVAPSAGIGRFLDQWEMNDLLFMVVLENLRPQAEVEPHRLPWFVLVPDGWSKAIVSRWFALEQAAREGVGLSTTGEPLTPRRGSFHLARVITGGAFLLLACWLAYRAARDDDPRTWCRAALLTLAWFWLTCPTQNPWYWCWVVPLLPFVRFRTWYFVAAATMLYYLRFWLSAQFPDPPVLGTRYDGEHFYYFVVPWIEFVPCLLALAVEWRAWRRKNRPRRH